MFCEKSFIQIEYKVNDILNSVTFAAIGKIHTYVIILDVMIFLSRLIASSLTSGNRPLIRTLANNAK